MLLYKMNFSRFMLNYIYETEKIQWKDKIEIFKYKSVNYVKTNYWLLDSVK